jgi:CrcB protein
MRVWWYVAIGSAVGGVLRFAVAGFIQERAGDGFPAGTLLINITGSFLLGVIMRYSLQTNVGAPETRALLATGLCGGYTTFSAFSYDTAVLLQANRYGRAAIYVGASVLLSLLGVFLGFAVAGRFIALST